MDCVALLAMTGFKSLDVLYRGAADRALLITIGEVPLGSGATIVRNRAD